MRITLESDYALRILSALAAHKEIVDAKTLADETSVTINFTLKILRKLVNCDMVNPIRVCVGDTASTFRPKRLH